MAQQKDRDAQAAQEATESKQKNDLILAVGALICVVIVGISLVVTVALYTQSKPEPDTQLVEASQQAPIKVTNFRDHLRALDKTGVEAEIVKYKRTRSALMRCGDDYAAQLIYYERINKPRIEELNKWDSLSAAEKLRETQSEMQKVDSAEDVVKYALTGGIQRQQEAALAMMEEMSTLTASGPAYSAERCQDVKTLVQRGDLNINPSPQ